MAMLSSSKGWSNLKAQSTHGAATQRVDMHMRGYRPNYNETLQVASQDARRLLPIIQLRNGLAYLLMSLSLSSLSGLKKAIQAREYGIWQRGCIF
jgi:hypothetical protein